jgi:hypothetical protein
VFWMGEALRTVRPGRHDAIHPVWLPPVGRSRRRCAGKRITGAK